jgi:murein tripeptide amidase MpaA
MKKVLCLLFCVQSVWAINTHTIKQFSPNLKSQVVRAYYSKPSQVQSLSESITPWEVNTEQKYLVFMLESQQDFDTVTKLGFQLRLDTKLQQKVNADKLLKASTKGAASIPGYACYSTVEDSFARMDTMLNNYPDLTEMIDIGDSWEKTINANNGYDMRVLKMTNKNINEVKPVLFIASAIHAREYATAELNTRFAEYLLSHYETDSDVRWMLDHQEVHFLLHNNPDGRKKAEVQTGGSPGWRKNTNQAYCSPSSNSRGADLNRNFPFGWLTSTDECSSTHSGSAPQSEPEISSLVTYLNTIYDDNRGSLPTDAAPEDTSGIFVDVHSYSQLILWPWGYTTGDSPNKSQFEAFGRRVAYFNDYKPEPAAGLYTAAGVSIDTSYGDLGVASIVYELGTAFYQDCAEFESKILPDNLQSLFYVSRVTRTPYIAPFGPDIEDLLVIPNVVMGSQNLNISGTANDDRYNHSNGTQVIGQVQSVESYINDLPWLAATGTAINALDGSYDTVVEGFNSDIAANQLSQGQNIVYVVATDSDGKRGAVFSQFVNLVNDTEVGTLTGQVINAVTGSSISGVKLEINQSLTLSDAQGNYTQFVSPTTPITANLMASADGYVSKTIENIAISNQQSYVQNIQLEPFCDLYNDDVENGAGTWQVDSPWGITTAQSASTSHSWTDSPTGQYQDNISKSMVSEAFNVEAVDSLELSFNHFCDTESGYDYGHVEVSFDGSGSWQEIYSCNGDANWRSLSKVIAVEANAQTMQFRFRLTSDVSVTRDGWYIDDVQLKASGAVCHFAGSDTIFVHGFE